MNSELVSLRRERPPRADLLDIASFRKKQIELLIRAASELKDSYSFGVIVAGGYDPHVRENLEYAEELKARGVKVYEHKIPRGRIILRGEAPFNFTVSCGANSDRSFSGCYFGDNEITTVELAKESLSQRIQSKEF